MIEPAISFHRTHPKKPKKLPTLHVSGTRIGPIFHHLFDRFARPRDRHHTYFLPSVFARFARPRDLPHLFRPLLVNREIIVITSGEWLPWSGPITSTLFRSKSRGWTFPGLPMIDGPHD